MSWAPCGGCSLRSSVWVRSGSIRYKCIEHSNQNKLITAYPKIEIDSNTLKSSNCQMHVNSVWILHLLLGLACFSRHLVGKREVCIIMVGLDRASCFMGAISLVSEHLCLDITNLPFAGFSRQNNDPVEAWDLLNTLDMRFWMILDDFKTPRYRLKLGVQVRTLPTVGFNVEKLDRFPVSEFASFGFWAFMNRATRA